jgi:hypothetical protein
MHKNNFHIQVSFLCIGFSHWIFRLFKLFVEDRNYQLYSYFDSIRFYGGLVFLCFNEAI